MKITVVALVIALTLPASPLAHVHSHSRLHQPDQSADDEANQIAEQILESEDSEAGPKLPASMVAQSTQIKKKATIPSTVAAEPAAETKPVVKAAPAVHASPVQRPAVKPTGHAVKAVPAPEATSTVHTQSSVKAAPTLKAAPSVKAVPAAASAAKKAGPKLPASMVVRSTQIKKQAPVEGITAADPVVKADAANAKEAASVAKQAAQVANNVAEHSMHITKHAQKSLHHALGALHDARVETEGLSQKQKESLKKAESRLREATKKADYGKLKKLEDKDAADIKKDKMQDEMDQKIEDQKIKVTYKEDECQHMREEIGRLRQELGEKGGDADIDKDLSAIEDELKNCNSENKDELKVEIERLREAINKLEAAPAPQVAEKGASDDGEDADAKDEEEKEELMGDVQMKPLGEKSAGSGRRGSGESYAEGDVTPVEEKGIDIDTQMPYGDLEPFGREDTAQELTEASVRESDEMVDQLERAEVAEEKRAVFRALTRLRGAAITSFDGVARSQTGNIDEYNKIHKWRKTHPLHHLADEESDVSKWAFPDNAD